MFADCVTLLEADVIFGFLESYTTYVYLASDEQREGCIMMWCSRSPLFLAPDFSSSPILLPRSV